MQGTQKNSRSPAQVLGIEGSEYRPADIHEAYKKLYRKLKNSPDSTSEVKADGPQLEEIEWAYREILTSMEIESTPLNEDSVLSALLIPGFSLQDISDFAGDKVENRKAPVVLKSVPKEKSMQIGTFEGRRVKTLNGDRDKAAVQTHAYLANSDAAKARALVLIETAEHKSGSLLRKLREEMGVDIDELSLRTKIAKRHLEFIEDDQYENLPAVVYVRGFVASYLRYLGLEREDIVEAITENYRNRKQRTHP